MGGDEGLLGDIHDSVGGGVALAGIVHFVLELIEELFVFFAVDVGTPDVAEIEERFGELVPGDEFGVGGELGVVLVYDFLLELFVLHVHECFADLEEDLGVFVPRDVVLLVCFKLGIDKLANRPNVTSLMASSTL